MNNLEINTFIEEMESIGDVWEPEEVERVYGNASLDEAVSNRKSDLGIFFNNIGTVLNNA